MAIEPQLPAELLIWNGMSPMERFAVMQRVPYQKSIVRRQRDCLAIIRAEMEAR